MHGGLNQPAYKSVCACFVQHVCAHLPVISASTSTQARINKPLWSCEAEGGANACGLHIAGII